MNMNIEAKPSKKSKDIERLINSSLDDIVKETQRERRMKKTGSQTRLKYRKNPNINNTRKNKKWNNTNSMANKKFDNSSRIKRRFGTRGTRKDHKEERVTKEHIKNIKIVAKLDNVPTPTAQQKAGLNNLEVTPSSISSVKTKKNRIFN